MRIVWNYSRIAFIEEANGRYHSAGLKILIFFQHRSNSSLILANIRYITHVVELFAAEDRLCLAVEKVPDKTVEKSTLPIILEQVDVEGAIISADAYFTVPESA
ncbi:MAG TPA: hypothetical protein DCE71_08065 [Parachlamydiales bacterium]|nr:hypothetical protein [Parachlamydiales bacterium]